MNLFRSRSPRPTALVGWIAVLCAAACSGTSVDGRLEGGAEAGLPLDAAMDSLACPPSCDDNNVCTDDSCDPATLQCVHSYKGDNTPCQAKLCEAVGYCSGGVCLDGPRKICPQPSDPCQIAGVCIDATGECSTNPAPDGKSCDDGMACTYADQCLGGKCMGTPMICSGGRACNPADGKCPPGGFPDSVSGWTFDNAGWPSNGSGLARSADGQLFLAGRYTNQLDLGLGPITMTAASGYSVQGDFDLFLAQLDPTTLKAAWVTTFPGPQAQSLAAFAVDGAEHIAVIGTLQGAIKVAGKQLTAAYPGDQFVLGARSRDGAGLWARRINLQSQTQLSGGTVRGLTAIAGSPNSATFLICGNVDCGSAPMLGDAGLDPNPAKDLWPSLVCQGGVDAVFALIDSSEPDGGGGGGKGATLWADQVGGSNDDFCSNVAIDDTGDAAFVIGTYQYGSELKFGNTSLPVIDQAIGSPTWMYLAKLDLTATQSPDAGQSPWQWAVNIGSGKQALSPVAMIAVDGDVVVAGQLLSGPQSVLGKALTSPYFVARFRGGDGGPMWIQEIGPGCGVTNPRLAVANGSIMVSGSYTKACTFGGVPFAPPCTRSRPATGPTSLPKGSPIPPIRTRCLAPLACRVVLPSIPMAPFLYLPTAQASISARLWEPSARRPPRQAV